MQALEQSAKDLFGDIYEGQLDFGHVQTELFIKWYNWRLVHEPKVDGGIPLCEFDMASVMGIFKDWVTQLNK